MGPVLGVVLGVVLGRTAGAVYSPLELIVPTVAFPPATPFADQGTAALLTTTVFEWGRCICALSSTSWFGSRAGDVPDTAPASATPLTCAVNRSEEHTSEHQ